MFRPVAVLFLLEGHPEQFVERLRTFDIRTPQDEQIKTFHGGLNSDTQIIYHSIRMNGSLPTKSMDPAGRENGKTAHPLNGAEHFIELLRTLADPIRLRIVRLLEARTQLGGASGPQDGLSVGELGDILKLPQSTVSRHLKTLADGEIAEARRDGTSTFYRLAESAGRNASRQLCLLARAHLDHDPVAKNDAHRLAAVLRKREAPDDFFGKHAPR